MTDWSLPSLLQSLSADVEGSLADARALIGHEGEKGGASEEVWRQLLRKHLPLRYQVDTGFVVDSANRFSQQLDIVIFDRQYSPLVFELGARRIFPAESVYAVMEVKQEFNAATVRYARDKVRRVRELRRTNLPVRDLEGNPVKRPLLTISGGILSLDSKWNPLFGNPFSRALKPTAHADQLDFGCVANRGWFAADSEDGSTITREGSASTASFLFHLISNLQKLGTVPMIDMSSYSAHLPSVRSLDV